MQQGRRTSTLKASYEAIHETAGTTAEFWLRAGQRCLQQPDGVAAAGATSSSHQPHHSQTHYTSHGHSHGRGHRSHSGHSNLNQEKAVHKSQPQDRATCIFQQCWETQQIQEFGSTELSITL
ncbi:hypothetical protein KR200_007981 [Drosophila serrata]|nr:hypothetical protein KR200_007981 [Drosophila serrata]